MSRTASISRNTNETRIELSLDLDNAAAATPPSTGVGFFDHMLTHIAKHGRMGLSVTCDGDTEVDDHHTVEDVGIVLGEALKQALGDKRGIERYGHSAVPMDEALSRVTLDLSGRPHLVYRVDFVATGTPSPELTGETMGRFDLQLVREFFQAVTNAAAMNLHIEAPYGDNNHHLVEAIFKAFGRALRDAVRITSDDIPSTKGSL